MHSLGNQYRQTCRNSVVANDILIPGKTSACRYIYDGDGECFCTEPECNTVALLHEFIQNYQKDELTCLDGRKGGNVTCENADAVCYIQDNGEW